MFLLVLFAYFMAGAFLVNGVPHFVRGVTGHTFPSPFAKPPGIGLSSPVVNVVWGWVNVVLGYVLLVYVGEFEIRVVSHAAAVLLGGLAMALFLASHFGKAYAGRDK